MNNPVAPLQFNCFEDYLAAQYAEVRPVTLNEKTFLEQFAFHQFQILQSRPLAQLALSALLADPENPELLKRHLAIQRSLRALERAAKQALAQLTEFTAHRLAQATEPPPPQTELSLLLDSVDAEDDEEEGADLSPADLAELRALEREILSSPPPSFPRSHLALADIEQMPHTNS